MWENCQRSYIDIYFKNMLRGLNVGSPCCASPGGTRSRVSSSHFLLPSALLNFSWAIVLSLIYCDLRVRCRAQNVNEGIN